MIHCHRSSLNFGLSFLLTMLLTHSAQAQTSATEKRAEILRKIEETRVADQDTLYRKLEQEYVAQTKAPKGPIAFVLGDSSRELQAFNNKMGRHSADTASAEGAYRQALTAQIIAETKGLSRQDARAYITKMAHQTFLARQRSHTNVRAALKDRLSRAKTDAQNARARAYAENVLRTRALEDEVYQTALRRHDGRGDASRMRELLRRVGNRKITLDASDIADSDARRREELLRRSQTELDIAEYRRLARAGTLLNSSTGRPVTGQSRLAMARDAERLLADRLKQKALKPSRYDIMAWMHRKDQREIHAKSISQEINKTPTYMALDVLSPKDFGNQGMRYMAVANALRKQQQGIADWRAKFVKGSNTGIEYLDGFNGLMRTGAGDLARIRNQAGIMSLDAVDSRIAQYNGRMDRLIPAIQEAGKLQIEARRTGQPVDLSKLSAQSRQILRSSEMLRGKPGSGRLVLDEKSRPFGNLTKRLNLPDDSNLNAVSGVNMLEMAASAYIPSVGSAKLSKMLRNLGVSKSRANAARIGTEMILGMPISAASEYAKTGKTDLTKAAIEGTLLQLGTSASHRVTGAAARSVANFLTKNPKARNAIQATLAGSMGLASESALQSAYQAKLQGTDVTYEMFLANLLNASMTGVIGRAVDTDKISQHLPEPVFREFAAANETVKRSKQRAAKRLGKVLGEDVSSNFNWFRGVGPKGLKVKEPAQQDILVKRMDDALSAGKISFAELKMLYNDNPGLEPVLKAVNAKRAKHFEEMVPYAQKFAKQELDAEFKVRRSSAEKLYGSNPEALKKAQARLKREYDNELRLINTQPKAPGSDNLTSDVDRSIASERVRKQLKQLYRGTRSQHEVPATSARSYDVNEYIDVFPDIRKTQPRAAQFSKLEVGEGDYKGLNQDEAIEAQGMATAMLHMNERQRKQYRQNMLDRSSNESLTKRQYEAAVGSLNRADRELQTEMKRLEKENPSLAQNKEDLAVRARDNLYGRRTEAIRKDSNELLHVEHELAALRSQGTSKDAPEIKKLHGKRDRLQAKIRRDWGTTLREGIETYASFSGLDSIVKDGQINSIPIRALIESKKYKRVKPGQKSKKLDGIKVFDSIGDDNKKAFLDKDDNSITIEKELSDRQVQAFLDDQVMMMTHHANNLFKGKEDVTDAASAFGKYAERAVLGLKLQGKDLSKPPYDQLSKLSKELVENRKDPVALKKVLRRMSSGIRGGNLSSKSKEQDGLLKFMKLTEKAMPSARGLWDAKKMGIKPEQIDRDRKLLPSADVKSLLATRRRILEDEEDLLLRYGPASARKSNDNRTTYLKDQLAQLEAKKQRRATYGKKYLREDWNTAEALEKKEASLLQRLNKLKELSGDGRGSKPIVDELRRTQGQLSKLRNRYTEKGGNGKIELTDDDKRDDARMAAIRNELSVRDKAAKRYEKLERENLARIAKAAPFPASLSKSSPTLPAGKVQSGQSITMTVTLGETSIQVPIKKRLIEIATGD